MKYRKQGICSVGPMLSYLTNLDKNGCEVMDGDGVWIDTPKGYE